MAKLIQVAEQFSRFPAGRTTGPANGASFREKLLVPALDENEQVIVDFNGVVGLPSSFLEEAFGGLVRNGAIKSLNGFSEKLKIVADKPNIHRAAELIKRYVSEALKNVK